MRFSFKAAAALALTLSIVLSLIILPAGAANSSSVIKTTPTGYTQASDVKYVQSGSYIANWGARGETCTFLSKYAQAYYTGSYTFENLASHAGGTSQGNAPQSDLYGTLKTFMNSTSTHQTSYDETKNQYKFTDCLRSDTTHISSFYSGKELSGTWDSGSTWNREHTWPNSKLDAPAENDIMMLRPTWVQENSSRGNTAYGESGSYYDPGVSTRGDCARIVLYVYVRWGATSRMWGTGGVMENMDVLLKWMEQDPVDTWEMGRNDAVQSITGVRNVFVDYPELAWLLFGKQVPASVSTPSNGQGSSVVPVPPTDPTVPDDQILASPVSSPASGSKVYIYSPQSGEVMSSAVSGTGFGGVAAATSGSKIVVTPQMQAFTVSVDANGYFAFQSADGKYLTSGQTGNALTLADSKTDCSLWVKDSNGLKNVGAQYGTGADAKDQYLEYYNGKFTTYGYNAKNADAYAFQFYALASSGTDPDPEPSVPVVTDPNCTHSHTVVKNASGGSCTQEGYSGDTYCADCGVKISSGYSLPRQEHIPVAGKPMEATCVQPGKEADTLCSVCGQVLSEGAVIPATGVHSFGDWVIDKEATETVDGQKHRICAVCDLVENRAIPAGGSDPAPTETTPPHTDPSEIVTQPPLPTDPSETVTQPTLPTEPSETVTQPPLPTDPGKPDDGRGGNIVVIAVSSAAVAAAAGGGAYIVTRKKKK